MFFIQILVLEQKTMFKILNPKKEFFQRIVRIAHLHPINTAKNVFAFEMWQFL